MPLVFSSRVFKMEDEVSGRDFWKCCLQSKPFQDDKDKKKGFAGGWEIFILFR